MKDLNHIPTPGHGICSLSEDTELRKVLAEIEQVPLGGREREMIAYLLNTDRRFTKAEKAEIMSFSGRLLSGRKKA